VKKLILLALIALPLAACSEQDPKTASRGQAMDIVRHMRFVRHPQAHDLCIGYVYVEDGGGNTATGGPAMIEVDCAKVEHLLTADAPAPAERPTAP
jgi:hypothetical protein